MQQVGLRGLASGLRSGEIDLVSYLSNLCDLIDVREPILQAFVTGTYSRDDLISQARELLLRYPEPSDRPALFGIPIGAKDIIYTEQFPTKCGTNLPSHLWDTGKDAKCIELLRKAGALIMAKTVTTEFACRAPNATTNPFDSARTPGGSSQGSGAAVGAGYMPAALGSQTGGSTLRPASFCNAVGYKCSLGRIDKTGMFPLSPTFDHVGLITSTVDDLNVLGKILVANWNQPSHSPKDIRECVFGVIDGPFYAAISENCQRHFESHVQMLQRAGATVIRVKTILNDFNESRDCASKHISAGCAIDHPWFSEYERLYRDETRKRIQFGKTVLPDLPLLEKKRRQFAETLRIEMESAGVDCLLSPAAFDHANPISEGTGSSAMLSQFTWAGVPTISIPMLLDSYGLPIGIQTIGYFGRDEELIRISQSVEAVFNENRSRQRKGYQKLTSPKL